MKDDFENVYELIEHAIDSGINLIDCANVYGLGDNRRERGTSEKILSNVLKSKRDELVVTSKVHSPMGDGPNDQGSSRYHILKQVEDSLSRMKTDRIDVYLLHGWDDDSPIEETARALDYLVSSGKVRYVGACNFKAWQVCKMLWVQDQLGASPLITLQNQYSLLKRDPEQDLFEVIRDQGLGAMAYSPLGVGLLSGIYGLDGKAPAESYWGGDNRIDMFKSYMTPETINVLRTVDEISRNRKELIAANYQINQRREFTEAILSGVSSGVIGLDSNGKVNLPNSKSLELLNISGKNFYGKKFIKLLTSLTA